jgi:hypothetical protein
MEVYAGMADAMDFHEVGRLVAHLKARRASSTTRCSCSCPTTAPKARTTPTRRSGWRTVQYSQDIDRLGGKGAYGIMGPSWASASASPLSTFKFYSGEGGIRVPLIIAGVPGGTGNQIHHSLTHVNDIVPTLLDLAQVRVRAPAGRGNRSRRWPGAACCRSCAATRQVRPPDQPLGYELSGNKALFKGDLKLVRNAATGGRRPVAPVRPARRPRRDARPAAPACPRPSAMQADYAAYARSHGVLPMPEGYNPVRQVLINSFINYWIPDLSQHGAAVLAGWSAGGRRRARDPQAAAALMQAGGYLDSPWPGEDGGPARPQARHGIAGMNLRPGETAALRHAQHLHVHHDGARRAGRGIIC